MQVLKSLAELRAARERFRHPLAFVATMGNLHAGHLRLVEAARSRAPAVAVSIYVNPLQFGAHEDLGTYPRTPEQDLEALARVNVDYVFMPRDEDIYPRGLASQTRVDVPGLSDILCGAFRPGHFAGVATVVCRLLHLIRPEVAVFGRKDYQQLLMVQRMVQDLALDIDIMGVATERAPDGLALSSRNGYLSHEDRRRAQGLYLELCRAASAVRAGAAIAEVEAAGLAALRTRGLVPDYFTVRRREDLAIPGAGDAGLIVLSAVRVGHVRLIDNVELDR
ncbi:MAG: pantoate--beta-alanine ligase [Acidiferrobacteraceae bacterium]